MAWADLKKGRFSQAYGEYFITFNCHNNRAYFNEFHLAHLFCQQIQVNEATFNCTWLAWVFMPDHFHGLLRLGKNSSLSQIIGDLKGKSANILNKQLQCKGKFWQSAFYDRALRKEEDRKNIARYIITNPLRKGLVKTIGDYSFWDSSYLTYPTG
ncbi:transposase [Alteromonadaceae bacterium BrNp21-10]|nr:transposase [Alteromonadaceae bacterium BrNp21-10]